MKAETAIDGADEADIALVHHQGDQTGLGKRLQFPPQQRIRRGVVHDHQFICFSCLCSEYAADRLQRQRTAAVDRHDDIDHGPRSVGSPVLQQVSNVGWCGIWPGSGAPPFFAAKSQPMGKRLIARQGRIWILSTILCW